MFSSGAMQAPNGFAPMMPSGSNGSSEMAAVAGPSSSSNSASVLAAVNAAAANRLAISDGELLLRYHDAPPSLVLHLHPQHFRFDKQHTIFSYDSPAKEILNCVRDGRLPADLLDLLSSSSVRFYEGCLIVEVLDHRRTTQGNSSASAATASSRLTSARAPIYGFQALSESSGPESSSGPSRCKLVLRQNDESRWRDLKMLDEMTGGVWHDEDALQIEAKLVNLTAPPLCLSTDPQVGRISNTSIRTAAQKHKLFEPLADSLPFHRSTKRRRLGTDVDEERRVQARARRLKVMLLMQDGYKTVPAAGPNPESSGSSSSFSRLDFALQSREKRRPLTYDKTGRPIRGRPPVPKLGPTDDGASKANGDTANGTPIVAPANGTGEEKSTATPSTAKKKTYSKKKKSQKEKEKEEEERKAAEAASKAKEDTDGKGKGTKSKKKGKTKAEKKAEELEKEKERQREEEREREKEKEKEKAKLAKGKGGKPAKGKAAQAAAATKDEPDSDDAPLAETAAVGKGKGKAKAATTKKKKPTANGVAPSPAPSAVEASTPVATPAASGSALPNGSAKGKKNAGSAAKRKKSENGSVIAPSPAPSHAVASSPVISNFGFNSADSNAILSAQMGLTPAPSNGMVPGPPGAPMMPMPGGMQVQQGQPIQSQLPPSQNSTPQMQPTQPHPNPSGPPTLTMQQRQHLLILQQMKAQAQAQGVPFNAQASMQQLLASMQAQQQQQVAASQAQAVSAAGSMSGGMPGFGGPGQGFPMNLGPMPPGPYNNGMNMNPLANQQFMMQQQQAQQAQQQASPQRSGPGPGGPGPGGMHGISSPMNGMAMLPNGVGFNPSAQMQNQMMMAIQQRLQQAQQQQHQQQQQQQGQQQRWPQ
ncbi:hypothetical protein A4X09_0g2748 [Tilletia walkeri]|uniref:Spt20-like SEP domain-containing protein n=1 Tax=Tilletia walkeri TaxID=117179 RepID=A0A8X7T5U4_9BASI|nr:hypothetical protein A4X09_0g2748 [Tilletia walkeri]